MPQNCLYCGKQLGSRNSLCYSCASTGISADEVEGYDEKIREKVEEYFIVAALRCADCGSLHGTVEVGGEIYTKETLNISTTAEWNQEMEKRERWIEQNEAKVKAILPVLAVEWPNSVAALYGRLS